jgi:ADP-ribosylation factor GTPase-activating protein 1
MVEIVQDDYNSRRSNNNGGSSFDIQELVQDPRAAVEKGWSLLSTVGKAAFEFGKYANDTYVKPAAAQIADPNFREQVRGNVTNYVSSFTQSSRVNIYCVV